MDLVFPEYLEFPFVRPSFRKFGNPHTPFHPLPFARPNRTVAESNPRHNAPQTIHSPTKKYHVLWHLQIPVPLLQDWYRQNEGLPGHYILSPGRNSNILKRRGQCVNNHSAREENENTIVPFCNHFAGLLL